MTDRIRIGPGLPPIAQPQPRPEPKRAGPGAAGGFQEALDRAMAPTEAPPLKLSAHARERLRESPLSEADLARVSAAVDQAARKGSRDALVLMRDMALVVSVQNRTVITAVSGDRMKENVFTQIDSAVIVTDS